VQESVMPQFQEALVQETLALKVGDPLQVFLSNDRLALSLF